MLLNEILGLIVALVQAFIGVKSSGKGSVSIPIPSLGGALVVGASYDAAADRYTITGVDFNVAAQNR